VTPVRSGAVTRERAATGAWALALSLVSLGHCLATPAEAGRTVHLAKPPLHQLRDSPPTAVGLPALWGDWFGLPEAGMLGNWFGLRPALAKLGIVPTVAWLTDVQGNPVGGQRQAVREFDNLYAGVDIDLEKLLRAPGTSFSLSLSQRSGTSLSDLDIGNVFNVAQVCCGATFRLVNVFLEQPFLDVRVNVRAGRISAGDEFLTSPLYSLFVQTGINSNPEGIFFNAPGMTTYPTATWGLRVRVDPVPQVYAMVGVFNGDPTLGENSKHGVDWTMRGPLFAIAEIGYRLNQEQGSAGLPGNYKIGGYFNDGRYPDFLRDTSGGFAPLTGLPPATTRGKTGFYVLADQMVYREPGGDGKRGLTPFISLLGAPDESVNQMPFFLSGGLVYRGLIPGRGNDVAAFAAVYGRFSKELRRAQRQEGSPVQDFELALEWTYVIQVTRWLAVQPDVQYIIKPGGTGNIPNALVLGFQLAMAF